LDPKKRQQIEQKLKKREEPIKKAKDKTGDFVKKQKKINKIGDVLVDYNKLPANALAIANVIKNTDVQIGIAGFGMVIGFFMINLYFPLVIIEFVLFLGIVFLLFPVLAGCYIFEATRNFATTSFNKTIDFSFKLIFICIAMVVCAALNDLILGGGLVKNTTDLTDILNNITTDNFTKEMLADWYFARVFLALFFNAVVMKQMGELAGWFGTNTQDSGLRSGIESLKNSFIKTTTNIGRDVKGYIKQDNKEAKNEKDEDEE